MRMMLKSLLKQVQITDVLEAENGMTGLEALGTQAVGLILLDLHMPHMDGLTFLREREKRSDWSAVPVIVISSDTENAQLRQAQQCGACSYITKPFRLEDLRDALACAFPSAQ
jgi:two-component system chemotaxis response regulator CheY